MFNNFFFENRTVYEIMWKNVVERGRPQMIIWRMRIACWIPKATNAHTGCEILIALPLQQWLHERASMLRETYIASLVSSTFVLMILPYLLFRLSACPFPKCLFTEQLCSFIDTSCPDNHSVHNIALRNWASVL